MAEESFLWTGLSGGLCINRRRIEQSARNGKGRNMFDDDGPVIMFDSCIVQLEKG